MDSLPVSVLSSIFQFIEAKEICRLSMVNKKWNRTSQSPYLETRWKQLFYKDFGEAFLKKLTINEYDPNNYNYNNYYAYKSFIPNYIEGLKQDSKLTWKEKYKNIYLSDEEDSIYKKYMEQNHSTIAPKIYGDPEFNPYIEYHKTKQIKSLQLFNPFNYYRVGKMMLFDPSWWDFMILRKYPPENTSWKIEKFNDRNMDSMVRRRMSILSFPIILFFSVIPLLLLFYFSNLGYINTSLHFFSSSATNEKHWNWMVAASFQTLFLFPGLWFFCKTDQSRIWPQNSNTIIIGSYMTICFWINWMGSGTLKYAIWSYLSVWVVITVFTFDKMKKHSYRFSNSFICKMGEGFGRLFDRFVTLLERTWQSCTSHLSQYVKILVGIIVWVTCLTTIFTLFSLWRAAILTVASGLTFAEAIINSDNMIANLSQKVRPPIQLFNGKVVITFAFSNSLIPRISFITYLLRILFFFLSLCFHNSTSVFSSFILFILSVSVPLSIFVVSFLSVVPPY